MLTFATTTSYGSWLPGDARGWVCDGKRLPADPDLERIAKKHMTGTRITFTTQDQYRLFHAMKAATAEFHYNLRDLAIETWHLHWIVDHDDPIATMMGRLKNRMRQALNRGRIWTEGYCANPLADDHALEQARAYIAHHPGCLLSAGIPRQPPGLAGGSS